MSTPIRHPDEATWAVVWRRFTRFQQPLPLSLPFYLGIIPGGTILPDEQLQVIYSFLQYIVNGHPLRARYCCCDTGPMVSARIRPGPLQTDFRRKLQGLENPRRSDQKRSKRTSASPSFLRYNEAQKSSAHVELT